MRRACPASAWRAVRVQRDAGSCLASAAPPAFLHGRRLRLCRARRWLAASPSRPPLRRAPTPSGIVVCTIEKAHALVQRMLEEDTLHNLGCVVVDELHMVGRRHNG